MEALLISADKLKVILTASDVDKYSLDCKNMDYSNTETRRAFWSILDDVKQQTGFDAASQRVLVQVYQSKGGGCELYVTKINGKSSSGKSDDSISLRINRCSETDKPVKIFAFDDMNNLLAVCDRLEASKKNENAVRESRIYSEEYRDNTRYYLVVGDNGGTDRYSFIEEYGKECTGSVFFGYLGEHCRCICDKYGIEIMARLR